MWFLWMQIFKNFWVSFFFTVDKRNVLSVTDQVFDEFFSNLKLNTKIVREIHDFFILKELLIVHTNFRSSQQHVFSKVTARFLESNKWNFFPGHRNVICCIQSMTSSSSKYLSGSFWRLMIPIPQLLLILRKPSITLQWFQFCCVIFLTSRVNKRHNYICGWKQFLHSSYFYESL